MLLKTLFRFRRPAGRRIISGRDLRLSKYKLWFWIPYEAFLLVERLKGPLSTQFTLLLLQTGDASFSATAQNIE